VKKKLKNVTHTVGAILDHRRRTPDKAQFVAQIKEKGLLSGGVGLVLYFINMKKKQKQHDGPVTVWLSSRFAEKLCPRQRRGSTITKLLVEFGFLVEETPPIIGQIPTEYSIPDLWIGVCPDKLNTWQRQRLAIAEKWHHDKSCECNPALEWVEQSLARVSLPETEALRKAMQNPRTEPAALDAMRYLRNYVAPYERRFPKIGYAGTIYTPIMSLPRDIVPTLLMDNEPVAQLDITSAHPSTLPRLLIEAESKYGITGGIAEAERLATELMEGRLYDSLAEELGIEPKVAKKRLLSALNGEDKHTYNDAVFLSFSRRFPVAKVVVGCIRKGDRKRLNRKMSELLAVAISSAILACAKLGLPVYPRADELVCRARDKEVVRRILATAFFETTTVNPRIGGVRVELEHTSISHLILDA
jgi:hypothetical protein